MDIFRSIVRTVHLTFFIFQEYVQSGRIFVDVVAVLIFFYIFFMMRWGGGIDAKHFFSLTSVFALVNALYTVSATLSLGDRPQNYVILSRHIGRAGYLLGLYLNAVIVLAGNYLLITLLALVLNSVSDLTLTQWVLGTIPLFLNVGLFAALLLLLSPMVFTTGWRLLVLSLFALAFSGNFFTSPVRNAMPQTLQTVLSSLQTIFSWPLVPVFSGFALSIERNFGSYALIVIVAQMSLLIALLGVAIFAFSRREIIFGVE